MPTAFQGIAPTHIMIPALAASNALKWATRGNLFASSTGEAVAGGLRRPGGLTIEPRTTKDAFEVEYLDKALVKIETDLMQTDVANLLNHYKLSKDNVQARVTTADGQIWNFVVDTGSPGAAAGSSLLSHGFEFTLTDKERTLKTTDQTLITNDQYTWLLANLGTASTGGTGGVSTTGLTAISTARSAYKVSGFDTAKVKIDGVSVGTVKDPKLTIKTYSHTPDDMERPIYRMLEVSIEVTMLQTAATDLQGMLSTGMLLDKTLTMPTQNGEIFSFSAGAIALMGTPTIKDGDMSIKLAGTARFNYNPDETTPAFVDWGVTTPGTVVFTRPGY